VINLYRGRGRSGSLLICLGLRRHVRVGAFALPHGKKGHDSDCSKHAADLHELHLFPTVWTVGAKNIGEWRYSGKVVQAAFIFSPPSLRPLCIGFTAIDGVGVRLLQGR
jgi:hypothetical protein